MNTTLANPLDQDDNEPENGLEATPEDGAKPKRSMRAAINLACKDCIYDEHAKGAGNWREQTMACTVYKCALFEFRPMSKPKKKPLPVQAE